MNNNDLQALRHAAHGALLFHNGLWGSDQGYMWAGADGSTAGHVPQWEYDSLNLLQRRHLIAVQRSCGSRDSQVYATEAGLQLLNTTR